MQPPALTLERGSGSCRDFAARFMEGCRQLGLACRFVSGYLFTFDTDAGNASTNAWAEVYLPGAGWKGFDPTSGEMTGNMMNPSQRMGGNRDRGYDGGNSWGSPGYGYGYGYGGPSPFGGSYGTAPYGPQPGGAPAGCAPPGGHVPTPAPLAPVPYPVQAARVSDLERRMGDLEADGRRQKTLLPPLRHSESGYGPRAP